MAELLSGKTLARLQGEAFKSVSADALKGKVVALYFSAHWCPPCRMFTPVLKDFYGEVSEDGLEVVFVSFDRSEKDQVEYMKEAHGDWLTIPHGEALIQELAEKYGVQGIPALIVIKPNGDVINKNARGDVQGSSKSPAQTLKDWKAAAGL